MLLKINKKKKTCRIVDFAVPVNQNKIKGNQKKHMYFGLGELKKTVEHKIDDDTNCK